MSLSKCQLSINFAIYLSICLLWLKGRVYKETYFTHFIGRRVNLSSLSINSSSIFVFVIPAVVPCDASGAEQQRPKARWWIRCPHWPQHLPRTWMHHRLHRPKGRAHVLSQMVNSQLPLYNVKSVFIFWHLKVQNRLWGWWKITST